TVKHVNVEFWQQFGPEILAHAAAEGKPDFFIFGEVFSGNEILLSHYTTEGKLPAVLDFKFQGAARSFASVGSNTQSLENFFLADDYYTDADSNAYALPTFIGNHDMGRFGYFMQADGVPADEQVDRSKLAHALMYFSRGVPVVYYGDEQGFTGNGGDKDARQDMFANEAMEEYDNFPPIGGTGANYSDDNFDVNHPLYQEFDAYAAVFAAHQALQTGAQIHRYSEASEGTYAFSRIDRDEMVEYVVAFNNSSSEDTAVVPTFYDAGMTFDLVHSTSPTTTASLVTDANGHLTLTVPEIGFVIYAAQSAVPANAGAPAIAISTLTDDQVVPLEMQDIDGNEILQRIEVGADVADDGFYEVTFAVKRSDQVTYTVIGTDNNAPYRVFYTPDMPEAAADSLAPDNVTFEFRAIVSDLNGSVNSASVSGIVADIEDPNAPISRYKYTVVHYQRPGDDYGNPEDNPTDYWGLHVWGDGLAPGVGTDWTSPMKFFGEDDFGRFAWVELSNSSEAVNFIVHQGDTKDPDNSPDRFFTPDACPEIWLNQGGLTIYTSQAEAQGFVTIHYNRPDNDYTGWGLYLWQDWVELVAWDSPHLPDGIDDYGAYFIISQAEYAQLDFGLPLNFIVKNGDNKDPNLDRSFNPYEQASIWLKSADEAIYNSRGHADGVVTLHYRRPAGDYGDFTSNDYNDFWGLHTWGAAAEPGWPTPRKPVMTGTFGIQFDVPLINEGSSLGYIFHRGDEKDPGPNQFLEMAKWGYEVWQLQGADPDQPYILPIIRGGALCGGDLSKQKAYWVAEDTIVWDTCPAGTAVSLYYTATGGLVWGETGVEGGLSLDLTRNGTYTGDKFPHLQGQALYNIGADDLALVPEILKGQFVVASATTGGDPADATGLQIPGVLDDLYTYNGELGVVWSDDVVADGQAVTAVPTLKLWAPTAKNVTLHIFADAEPSTTSTTYAMTLDPNTGVWSYTGESGWMNQYYLYEVEVYVPSTGQVENNIVTDPYSFSLAMNSTRSQIVDLADPALAPAGWEDLVKPTVSTEEDISIYEVHVRDFSIFDETVPEAYRGTYKAFTQADSNGMMHLADLADAGLTHLHLLPVFDIATINEDVNQRQEPDYTALRSFGPASDQQQVIIENLRNLDGFNWGYDPFHYTAPEGSYSTVPTGTTRIVEFREMVQSLNETGLLVV
ncbi:MAG: hypothetical protein KDD89_05905, partial [Anaerolineales bacterium]|nr:hypothetical protein [Anaerolineales bacterium]